MTSTGAVIAAASRPRRFFWTYLVRSLLGRRRQSLVTSVGLAVGVTVVVTLTAASAGVSRAQGAVLHALYGVGTDITVTTSASESSGSQSGAGLIGPSGVGTERLSLPPGLGLLDSKVLARIAKVHGVAEVAAGLTFSDTKVSAALSPDELPPLTSTRIEGIDVAHTGLGPYSSTTLKSGRSFTQSDADSYIAVVETAYAASHNLHKGSTIPIDGSDFTVVGIVNQPTETNPTDVYIPLARAQAFSYGGDHRPLAGSVNAIYVAVASAADISDVSARIAKLVPTATVTSSADLANRVNGSLAGASRLSTELSRWLAVGLLIAAVGLTSLLTTGAVRRRLREFGTLRAIGWPSRRIVGQVMAESLVTGVAGGVTGAGLGALSIALIRAIAPTVTAIVALNPGSTPPQGALINSGTLKVMTLPGSVNTVSVHVSPNVDLETILLAIGLAIGGAILAGILGSWQAARMRPADALVSIS